MNWRLSWPMEKVPARRWRRLWRPGPVSIMQLATLKVKLLMNAKWAKGCRQRGKEERREGGGDKGCTTLQLQFYGVYKRNERSVSARSLRPMPIYMQLSWPSGAFEVCVSFHSVPATFLAWPGWKCAHYAPRCCACLTMTLQTLQLILNPNSSLKPNWTVPGRNCDLKRRPCIINWASYLHLVSHTHAHTFACIHITLHTHR